MPALNRGVTLNRQAQYVYNAGLSSGYRFTITVSGGVNIPNEIFRYTRMTINSSTSDVFEGICTSEQLINLPIGTPGLGDPNQYFRLNNVDLVFQTKVLADAGWSAIQEDIALLIKAMKINDVLGSAEVTRIGDS